MTMARVVGVVAVALGFAANADAQDATSVKYPAGYAEGMAVCVRQAGGTCKAVAADAPLPSTSVVPAATSTPLAGTSSGAQTVGPFTPQPIAIAVLLIVVLSGGLMIVLT